MNNSKVSQIYTTVHKIKQINLKSALDLMPQSEMIVMSAISKLLKAEPQKLVYVSDVAQLLEISAPAVSRTLNHLEEKLYIERLTDQGDRRNVCITITDTGRAAIESDMKKVMQFVEKALSHLEDNEITQFAELFNKVYEAMKSEIGKIEKEKGE